MIQITNFCLSNSFLVLYLMGFFLQFPNLIFDLQHSFIHIVWFYPHFLQFWLVILVFFVFSIVSFEKFYLFVTVSCRLNLQIIYFTLHFLTLLLHFHLLMGHDHRFFNITGYLRVYFYLFCAFHFDIVIVVKHVTLQPKYFFPLSFKCFIEVSFNVPQSLNLIKLKLTLFFPFFWYTFKIFYFFSLTNISLINIINFLS